MKIQSFVFGLSALLLSMSAAANVEVRFVESAPKDSFIISNNSECDLKNFVLKLDLTTTRGQLIFDVTAAGAGVEVFQPFENGDGGLTLVSSVADGDQTLSVRGPSIQSKQKVSFTIDVDDTLKDSDLGQIRVTGTEMENGSVSLTADNAESVDAKFGAGNRASMPSSGCTK